MRGLPWYTVVLLSLAAWAVVFAIVAISRHFRPPPSAPEPGNEVQADADAEPALTGVVSPSLAAEFTNAPRPYANGVLAVGEDPGGHVSLRDGDTDEGDS